MLALSTFQFFPLAVRGLAFAVGFSVFLAGCSSVPTTGVLAPKCAKTSVRESDLTQFGFTPVYGKVVVMRIFATWCPFCKTDLMKIAREFKDGHWTPDKVNVFLLAYKNHDETRATFDAFVKNKFNEIGIPREAVQLQFLDKTYSEAVNAKSASGEPLFTSWKGIPFGLVFGKDGRLAFRGHFTMNDVYEENHYQFITDLEKETCTP